MQDELLKQTFDKGQLISEGNFGVFKSPKKQKSVKELVGFLEDLKTPKFHSEIT